MWQVEDLTLPCGKWRPDPSKFHGFSRSRVGKALELNREIRRRPRPAARIGPTRPNIRAFAGRLAQQGESEPNEPLGKRCRLPFRRRRRRQPYPEPQERAVTSELRSRSGERVKTGRRRGDLDRWRFETSIPGRTDRGALSSP